MKRGTIAISTFVIMLVLFATFSLAIFVTVKYIYKGDDAVQDIIGDVTPGGLDRKESELQIQQPSEQLLKQFNAFVEELDRPQNGPCLLPYKLDLNGFSVLLSWGNVGWIAQLINPQNQGTHFPVIRGNKLCVVGDEIYGSDVYLNGEPIMKLDSQPSYYPAFDRYANDVGLFFESFGYNKQNDMRIAAKNFYTNWIQDIDEEEYTAARAELQQKEPKYLSESYLQNPLYNLNPAQIRKQGKRIVAPDYTNPRAITIKGNSMSINYGSDRKDFGKEDGGLLYVPESGRVCLFATDGDFGWDCDPGYPKGVDNDC